MLVATWWGMLRILLLRPLVVLYANDTLGLHACDPRMAAVISWLNEKGVRYLNLVHTPPHGRVTRYWWRRNRPIIYLDVLGYAALVRTLRFSGAQHLWAMDDYRFWPRVVAAGKQAGMRVVLFQHGRFTEHQSYLALPADAKVILPDAYVIWNRYWKERLIAVSPLFAARSDVLLVGGKAGQDSPNRASDSPRAPGGIRVLMVHEPAAPPEEVHAFLLALTRLPDSEVSYKIRGDQSEAVQSAFLGSLRESISITTDIPPCDVALGSYSTLLYELIERAIPVGVVRLSSMQADELVRSGLASMIDPHDVNLGEALRIASHVPVTERNRRADILAVRADVRNVLGQFLMHQNVRN